MSGKHAFTNAGRLRATIAFAYLVALHITLAAALLWPDAVRRRIDRLLPPSTPVETVSAFRLGTMALQNAIDMTARPGAVWFLGDSIVQMMDTGRITDRAINLGIGEDTIPGVRARVGAHPALAGAAGVVLAIGVNDLSYRSPDEAARDYASLLASLPPALPIVASAVLPVDERAGRNMPATRNAAIGRLNAAIATLCAARAGCRFVDAGPSMTDDTGRLAPAMHNGDGLHLSREGYQRLIGALLAPVREHLPPRA